MVNPDAARLASHIRAVMEREGLSGRDLADRIERLTGTRPSDMWVSRYVNGVYPLFRPASVSPHLRTIAEALGVPYRDLLAIVVSASPVVRPPQPSRKDL